MATGTPFDSAFDAKSFRDNIRATMIMGLPVSANDQPTFVWTKQATYANADPSGKPYQWTETASSQSQHVSVKVPCAVQFKENPIQGDPLGTFDASSVVLTLLDEDYVLVEGANQVVIGGISYNIDLVGPPQGLFSVNVFTIFATAVSTGPIT